MNIQEYISSGIIESYVLGLATDEERQEFERMCAEHHEVRKARESFELSLEKHTLQDAVKPPNNIKSKIFAEIEIQNEKLKDQKIVKSKPYKQYDFNFLCNVPSDFTF